MRLLELTLLSGTLKVRRCGNSKSLLLTTFQLESSTFQYTSSWEEKSETRSRSTLGLEAIAQGMSKHKRPSFEYMLHSDHSDSLCSLSRRTQGFTAVKMNATEDLGWLDSPSALDACVERVKTVKSLGMDAGVDFHGRVHKPMARQLAALLAPHRPLFIEEPLLSEHIEAIKAFAQSAPSPIALGERLHSRWDVKPFLEAACVDILQPDISHVGGISELRRIAAMAEAYDVAIAPHCPLGPIALAANIQVDATTSNFAIQEMSLGIHYNTGGHDLLSYIKNPEIWDVDNGYIKLMTGPGLGIDVDEDKIRQLSKDSEPWVSPGFTGAGGEWREW